MLNRKKFLRAGASAALFALLLPLQAWAQVVILHTNDIHCGVDRNLTLARVAACKETESPESPDPAPGRRRCHPGGTPGETHRRTGHGPDPEWGGL